MASELTAATQRLTEAASTGADSLVSSVRDGVSATGPALAGALGVSPVQLLTAAPSLGAANVHDVVQFVATPGATTSLAATLGGSGISLLADATPADQLAGLQQSVAALGSILTRFVQSILNSGPHFLMAAGDLLSGSPQSAVLDIGTVFTDPLLASQDDLGAFTAGLAQVFPAYAAGFNAISSDIILPALSILGVPYGGIGPDLQAIFDGTVNGLKAGDLAAAITGAVNGFQTLITGTANAIFGDPAQGGFGLIPAFTQYFQDVAAAFAGTTATTDTTATTTTLQRNAVTLKTSPDAATAPASTDAAAPTAATAATGTPSSDASTASETPPSTDATSSHVTSPATTSSETATGTTASDTKPSQTPSQTSSETSSGATTTTNGSTSAKSTAGASTAKSTDAAKDAAKDTTTADKP